MADTSKLNFAARQRIYDEEISREKMFRTLFLRYQEDTPIQYFLNPFRGKKNNAVTDPVGGDRGKRFLDRDEAFLRARSNTPTLLSSAARARSASVNQVRSASSNSNYGYNNCINNHNSTPPLPELVASRAATPFAASVTASNITPLSVLHQAAVSPSNSRQQQQQPLSRSKSDVYGGYEIDENGKVQLRKNATNLYDPSTSEGRSLARMRISNAVLKPRTQLVGEAVKFDQQLKEALRGPQERYGIPRTAAHDIGWYHKPFAKVDKPSRDGRTTSMSTGTYYKAKGLKTHFQQDAE